MRGLTRAAVTGALAVLLLVSGVPAVVDWVTGRAHADPACRSVAFMSMTDVTPDCR
ncbi:hypothetical protein [Streptomyces venezuelae]|uniref:hypothetical protein n=1 Tax=Streptomyces venezuelae TaxID=54571 RepID=UPI001684BF21|nr:hypothetical protein [Streptomyces venezuelae]